MKEFEELETQKKSQKKWTVGVINHSGNPPIWKMGGFYGLLGCFLCFLLLCLWLFRLQILSLRFWILLLVFFACLFGISAILVFSKKTRFSAVCSWGVMICTYLLMLLGAYRAMTFESALEAAASFSEEEKTLVAVVNRNQIESTDQLQNAWIGILDQNLGQTAGIEEKLLSGQAVYQLQSYSDISTMIQNLAAGNIQGCILPAETLSVLEDGEMTSQINGQLKVLADSRIKEEENLDLQSEPSLQDLSAPKAEDSRLQPYTVLVHTIDPYNMASSTGRSDLMMLYVINPVLRTASFVQLPANLQLPVHASIESADEQGIRMMQTGMNDSNIVSHLGLYDPRIRKETIMQQLGITVDYLLEIDYEKACAAIDELESIEIDNPAEFETSNWIYPAGRLFLDGKQAVYYGREGQSVTEKANAKRRVLEAVASRISSVSEFFTPFQWSDASLAFSDAIDSDLSKAQLLEIMHIFSSRENSGWQLEEIFLNCFPVETEAVSLRDTVNSSVLDIQSIQQLQCVLSSTYRSIENQ